MESGQLPDPPVNAADATEEVNQQQAEAQAELQEPDHPDEVDSDRHRQNRQDLVDDEGLGQE